MKPKAIPREKRLAIQRFVDTHEQCRVILGEVWRAHTVYVVGYGPATSKRLLVGRPRTPEAASELRSNVETFVSVLNQIKGRNRKEPT